MILKSKNFHRQDYFKFENLATVSGISSLHLNIRTILRLSAIFGIDVLLPTKRTDKNRKTKMTALTLYRWFFVFFMCYSLAARLYKAAQPDVPFILSFSESVATASSVVLRFTFLLNKTSIFKLVRMLSEFPVNSLKSSIITRQRILFYLHLVAITFILCLSLMKAITELLNPLSFNVYRKAYTFSADFTDHALLSTVTNAAVCVLHLLYIVQLYGIPSLALLLCCTVCRTVVLFLQDAEKSLKDEMKVCPLKDVMRSLRRMHCLVNETENSLSPMLFFLYSYLMSSLFFIVSLIIRKFVKTKIK